MIKSGGITVSAGKGKVGAKALTPRYKGMPINHKPLNKVKPKPLKQQDEMEKGKTVMFGGGVKHPHKFIFAENHIISRDANGGRAHVRLNLKARP